MKTTLSAASNRSLLQAWRSACWPDAPPGNPKDPIEGFNRAMFAFNEGLDSAIVKPVAKGYEAVLPSPIRTGVTNFFANIEDVFIGVNNLLQGKIPQAFNDFGRVAINSTIGLLGVLDIASDAGLEKHDEDFGQTFGRWGVGNGAYVVIPVFGPRTARDTVGLVLDVLPTPSPITGRSGRAMSALVLRMVNDRANLLPADKVVEEAALDKYSYIRDAYLQRRRNLIHDGNPPRETEASLDPTLSAVALPHDGGLDPRAEHARVGLRFRTSGHAARIPTRTTVSKNSFPGRVFPAPVISGNVT
jgi:phospholipid-binding lipoprotein MlaA